MITYKELSSTKVSQVEDIHALAVAERFRKRYENAFTTFYDLDEEQIKLFSNMIGRYVKFGKNLKFSQHPVASALNEYARYEACKINNGLFLNIGGNPNKEKGLHFCNLVNDCRNEARLKNINNCDCCFDGAENCDFKSDYAVAVDSLYDIKFEDIYLIFKRHELKVLHAWMFLPLELIDNDIAKIPNPLFRLNNMDKFGKTVAFSFMNDFSSVYTHNKANWAKYLTNTCIIGDEFCIDIEIVRTYGPFCHLIFNKVGSFKPSTRLLPFFDFYNNFIKIPDYRYLVNRNMLVKYEKTPKIVVPKYVFQKLYSYVTRGPDNSFSYERGATYFHGITSKIIIGNQVYVEDLGKLGHEYDDILFSVMCLAAQSRLRRTKNFGKFMRSIDNDFDSSSKPSSNFFNNIKVWFDNFLNGNVKRGDLFNIEQSYDFMMFDFEFFENKFQDGYVDIRGCKMMIKDNFIARKHFLTNNNSTDDDTSSEFSDQTSISGNSEHNTNYNNNNSQIETVTNNDDINSICSDNKDLNFKCEQLIIDEVSSNQNVTDNAPNIESNDNNNNAKINTNSVENDTLSISSLNSDSTSICTVVSNILTDDPLYHLLTPLIDNKICNDTEIIKLQNYHNHLINDQQLYLKIKEYEREILYSEPINKGLNRGASKMKFMLNKYVRNWKELKTLDISLAPGYYGRLGFKKIRGGYFKGANHVVANKTLLKKYDRIYEYINISDLNFKGYDLILCDVGSEDHRIKIYRKLRELIKEENKIVIVKFYLEHFEDCVEFCNNFKKITIIKPAFSFSLNRELYAICEGLSVNSNHNDYIKSSFYACYLSIIRAYEVYFKGLLPCIVDSKVKNEKTYDSIKVCQEDVNEYINDLIISIDNGNSGELADFIRSVIDNIKNVKIDFASVDVTICNGPPGSCKSEDILNLIDSKSLIIVPTKELRLKYENKLKTNKKKCRVITMHKVFSLTKYKFNDIFVDEASMQIKGYFALIKYFFKNVNIHLYFDSEQIGTVDFNNSLNNEEIDFERNYDYNKNVSYRCPIDVGLCYSKPFHTVNKKIFSIVSINYTEFSLKPFLRSLKVLCLTQATKNALKSIGYNVNTVHEYQGGADEHIVFYNDVNDLLLVDRLPRHINTAMSRHSNTLIIVGEIQGNYDLCIHGTAAERMLEINNTPVTSEILMNDFADGPIERLDSIKLCKIDDKMMHDIRDNFDLNRSIDVIGKFINIYGIASTFKSIRTTELPEVKQGKANINPDIVCKPEFVETGKYLTEFNTARAYDSKDYFTAVKTLLGRYGLKTKKFSGIEIEEGVKMLEKGLNVWLKYKIDSTKFKEIMHITQEEWSECFIDYCFKLNAKKNLKPGSLEKEITELDQKNGLMAIEYFMKKQDKFDVDYEMILKQKFGQGVNSWDKMMNIVFAAYSRLFGRKLRLCMKDNVIYANGMSDVEIGNKIAANIAVNKKHGIRYNYAENDMEEYDTSQNEITIENEVRWLRRLGCNEFYVQLFRKHRLEWKTVYPGYCQFIGYGKKHSGEPFTLDFNTLLCMCLNGLIFPLEEFVFASFKGDDSELMSDNVEVCNEGMKVCQNLGFKTKLRTGNCSEFIGYIVTPYGFYPDLLRIACKLLNKRIADDNEGRAYFEELKLAAYDRLQVIDCYEVRETGRKMYMDYMNQKFKECGRNEMLNDNDVFELENLLFNFKNIDYDSLIKRVKVHIFIDKIKG